MKEIMKDFDIESIELLAPEELYNIHGGSVPPVYIAIGKGFGAGGAAAYALISAYEWGYNLADRAFKRNAGWN